MTTDHIPRAQVLDAIDHLRHQLSGDGGPVVQWITPREAATRTGLSVRRLAQLADAGTIVSRRTAGGQRRYTIQSIEEALGG